MPDKPSNAPSQPGDDYACDLRVTNAIRKANTASAIDSLPIPPGGKVLDAGCGIGLQAIEFARAVGPAGTVFALDISERLLERARENARLEGMSERIRFFLGDVGDLPFEDGAFNLAWSSDCVGYAPGDPIPLVSEMERVVASGGVVALMAWTSERLLPGFPLLEAHLSATPSGMAPFQPGTPPEHHFRLALGWLKAAGLEDPRARTFVAEAQAPLPPSTREALVSLVGMRWPKAEDELPPEDRELFKRLCTPGSPDFILDREDYYAFYTETLFRGTVP